MSDTSDLEEVEWERVAHKEDRAQEAESELASAPCCALEAQRNALAEARLRIIARYEQVLTWMKREKDAPEDTIEHWAGIVEGLSQARRIIGGMWDELPVPKPQAVIDHEKHMDEVMAYRWVASHNDADQATASGGRPNT